MEPLELRIALPDWANQALAHAPATFPSAEDRMRFVVDLARSNVRQHTGGPFAAAVFDDRSQLVALGVNLVETARCSILHAEIVAIALAQKRLGRFDLANAGQGHYELVTATEPCAMCLGAIPWSGLSRVVCGARDEDARKIGFDEGPKPTDWTSALAARGIQVQRDVLRQEGVSVLEEYVIQGGLIYNPGPH